MVRDGFREKQAKNLNNTALIYSWWSPPGKECCKVVLYCTDPRTPYLRIMQSYTCERCKDNDSSCCMSDVSCLSY